MKITGINCIGYIVSHISLSSSDVFTDDDVMQTEKNDVSLCKLDVDVKNRTVVAGSIGFFKTELKTFRGKYYT